MPRRIHLPRLVAGPVELPADVSHHLRDVLRARVGDELELADDAGWLADGRITGTNPRTVSVLVGELRRPAGPALRCVIASAVPKGARVDWMIEKLSELGVARFVPLACERSVVLPAGTGKVDRWQRIAAEAARQSRRTGVMEIAPLTPLGDLLAGIDLHAWFLSTAVPVTPMHHAISAHAGSARAGAALTVLVGPEGGWTDLEMAAMRDRGLTAVSLGETILRVETAAIAAAACVAAVLMPQLVVGETL